MKNYVYIDTAVIGMLLFLFFVMFLGFVFISCTYLKEARKNEKLRRINKDLRFKLSTAQDKLYKVDFKVPDIDSDYSEIIPRYKLEDGVNG